MTSAENEEFVRIMEATYTPDETAVMEFIARQTIAYLEKAGETRLVSLAKQTPPPKSHKGYGC